MTRWCRRSRAGLRSVDTVHLHTVELNFLTSGSLDDPSFAPLVQFNAAYTYYPTYAQVLKEYNRPNFMPVRDGGNELRV